MVFSPSELLHGPPPPSPETPVRNRPRFTQRHCPALTMPWRSGFSPQQRVLLQIKVPVCEGSSAEAWLYLHPTDTRGLRGWAGPPPARSTEQLGWLLRGAAGFLRFHTTVLVRSCGNGSLRAKPPSGRASPQRCGEPTGAASCVWMPGLGYVGCSWGFAASSLGFAIDKNLPVNKCLQNRSWANESFWRGK